MKRYIIAATPLAAMLLLMTAGAALGAPPNVQDITNRSCATSSSWFDALMRAVAPMLTIIIGLGIVGVIFAGDRMNGVLHQVMSIVGQHTMAFVFLASAGTIAGLIVIANGLTACP